LTLITSLLGARGGFAPHAGEAAAKAKAAVGSSRFVKNFIMLSSCCPDDVLWGMHLGGIPRNPNIPVSTLLSISLSLIG
jgi:hypothetical protein